MKIDVHRFVVLDLMRTIAALAVVTVHTGRVFPGIGSSASGIASPQLAVDFFFLLSGFVLASAYQDKLGEMGLREFLKLRLIRLYPLYALSIIINLYWLLKHASHHPPVYFVNLGLALAFLPSPFSEALYPFGALAWTLLFEILANLVFAALKKPPAPLLILIVALAGALMIFGATTNSFGFKNGVIGGETWATFTAGLIRVSFSFFGGVLLYRVWSAADRKLSVTPVIPLGLLAVFLFIKTAPQSRPLADLLTVMVVWPVLVFAGASYNVRAPRVAKLFALIGGASYPIYLLHFLIYEKLQKYLDPLGLTGGFVLLAVVLAISIIVDLYYDIPVRRWLSRKLLTPRSSLSSLDSNNPRPPFLSPTDRPDI